MLKKLKQIKYKMTKKNIFNNNSFKESLNSFSSGKGENGESSLSKRSDQKKNLANTPLFQSTSKVGEEGYERKNPNLKRNQAKQEIVSVTYEEIGLFPRSFSRVLDRFLKQVFSDVENLVIQEYRFYRYLFLTTVRCLFILFFVPFLVNFFSKNYLIHPLTEYFWNTKQTEIFLNSYQQKRAFAELKEFEEKLYFESLINTSSTLKNLSKTGDIQESGKKGSEVTDHSNSFPINNTVSSQFIAESTTDNIHSNNKQFLNNGLNATLLSGNKEEFGNTSLGQSGNPREDQNIFLQLRAQSNVNSVDLENSTNIKTKGEDLLVTPLNMETMPSNLWSPQSKSSLSPWKQTLDGTKSLGFQEKIVEIATRYNDQSIEAITNFFADLLSLMTLFYLLFALEIQINITKSFLLEVFFGLDDSKKSLFILLITDLLVGYHSSNIWELFFSFIFNHYGLPESQTGIFLLVATLPVLLDVLFKYLIFRHLNRSSPATVATYHAMIE